MPETDIWGWLGFDKVAHLFVFAVLVLLMIVGFSKQYKYLYIRYNAVWLSLTICLAYGLLIEGVQALIPDRTLEYGDFVADSLGCGIGYAIFYGIYKS
ncbi:MAG: VanZ family protein [Bacteroidota bacterium]